MATDRLKNNCPIASNNTVKKLFTVSPSRFGIRYNFKPSTPVLTIPSSPVFLIVMEKIAIPITRRISNGMMILEKDSIPLLTPRNTINAVTARNINIKMTGSISDVIKPVK